MVEIQANLTSQLAVISENIKQLTALQNVALDRLSIKHRIKALLGSIGLSR